MSLILDALKKSEREREPDTDSYDPGDAYRQASMDRHMPALLGGAAVIILLLIILLVVLLWPKTDSAAVSAVRPEVVQAPVVREAPMQSRPVPPRLGFAETVIEPAKPFDQQPSPLEDPEVQALYRSDTAQSVPQPPQVSAVEPQGLTPEQQHIDAVWRQMQTESKESLVDLRQQVEQENSAREQNDLRQADQRQAARQADEAAAAEAPEPDTLAAYSDLPFLHELTESDQNRIPSLMYSKHNYEEGVVVINKRSLREGDAAASGVFIERLLADGVVLKSNLHSFRLSAKSSWVNR